MKKFILFLMLTLMCSNIVFASEVKDEMYYKRQIQNQRFLYSEAGLVNAIKKDNQVVVEAFMKAGMNPNATYVGTPIVMYALYLNKMNIFDFLLKSGADPETQVPAFYVTIKSQNLLSYAIKKKNSEAVQILINNRVDVNKEFNKRTPLNFALKQKQPKIVEMLLNAGAKVDEKTIKLVNKTKDEYIKDLFK